MAGASTVYRPLDGVSALAVSIEASKLASSIVNGVNSKGSITAEVTDPGAPLSGSVTVQFYASQNGQIDGGSVLLGTKGRQVKLSAGKGASYTVSFKTLPTTLEGTYQVFAQAIDPTGAVSSKAAGAAFTIHQGGWR